MARISASIDMTIPNGTIQRINFGSLGLSKTSAGQKVLTELDECIPRDDVRAPPLFHYTNSPLEIIESQELWLTESRFMNDIGEFEYGWHIVRNELRFKAASAEEKIREDIIRLDRWLEQSRKQLKCYIFSMSEHNEMDSQWRRYAKGATGASVSVQLKMLMDPRLRLIRCRYSLEDQYSRADALTDQLVDAIRALHATEVTESERAALWVHLQRKSVEATAAVAASLKSPRWVDEREWRLVRLEYGIPLDVHHATRMSGEVFEYVKEKPLARAGPDKGRLPIDWISVRSSPPALLGFDRTIADLVRRKGYGIGVFVAVSSSYFRYG